MSDGVFYDQNDEITKNKKSSVFIFMKTLQICREIWQEVLSKFQVSYDWEDNTFSTFMNKNFQKIMIGIPNQDKVVL